MNKGKLIEDLKIISTQMNHITNWVWFVNAEKVKGIENNISFLISELEIQGIDIETVPKIEHWIEFCPMCNQKISLKRRRLEKTMIIALIKAVDYCKHNRLKTFHKKDVLLNPVEYTLITFLVKFWLLYKSDDMVTGQFWIPFKRVSEFIQNKWSVAEFYDTNPLFKEWQDWFRTMSENRIYFKDIKSHDEILKDYPYTIEILNNSEFESII